jgi:hypothetical protein
LHEVFFMVSVVTLLNPQAWATPLSLFRPLTLPSKNNLGHINHDSLPYRSGSTRNPVKNFDALLVAQLRSVPKLRLKDSWESWNKTWCRI